MDLHMFLVFPGILITIGVSLLLISIIIVIVAYKTADKPAKSSLSDGHYEANVKTDGYYDNGKPKIILEATSKEEPKEDLETTKPFTFPVHKNAPITEMNNDVMQRINKMDEEFGKDITKKDELIKIPDIPPVKQEEQIDMLNEEFSSKEEPKLNIPLMKKEEEEDIELL